MAEIEDVMDKLDDVIDKINDCIEKVDTLEVKVNTLDAKANILKRCDNGECVNGKVPRSIAHQDGQIGPDVEYIDCPVCNGDIIIKWGYLSPEEG